MAEKPANRPDPNRPQEGQPGAQSGGRPNPSQSGQPFDRNDDPSRQKDKQDKGQQQRDVPASGSQRPDEDRGRVPGAIPSSRQNKPDEPQPPQEGDDDETSTTGREPRERTGRT